MATLRERLPKLGVHVVGSACPIVLHLPMSTALVDAGHHIAGALGERRGNGARTVAVVALPMLPELSAHPADSQPIRVRPGLASRRGGGPHPQMRVLAMDHAAHEPKSAPSRIVPVKGPAPE